MVRRLGWGVADQVVSSLTNFAVSIYVVHVLGAVQFGAFSLAYVTYGFALNASRGLATDPLMVRFSGTDVPTWRRAVTSCTGTAAVTGLTIGACVIAVAAVIHGAAGEAFLALGLTLPGLMLQDSWRYSFFALGRGGQAFLNDTIWALTLLPALALLRMTGHANVFWFVFAWGITATIAAAVGPFQARVIPRLAGTWDWLSGHRDLGPRYLIEGTSYSVSTQVRTYGIGIILGLAALGSVQAASTLFGPMTILFLGMSLVTIPEAARVLLRSPRHLPQFCLLITGGLTLAGIAWGLFLLFAVPRGFGSWLLGPIWRTTYPLVLPQMFFVVGQGVGFGVSTGLHALGASKRSLRQAVLVSVFNVICSIVGALVAGAAGSLWGASLAPWMGSIFGWRQLRIAHREHLRRLADGATVASVADPDLAVPGGAVPPELVASVPVFDATATMPIPVVVLPDDRRKAPAGRVRALVAAAAVAVLAAGAATGWMLAHAAAGAHHAAAVPTQAGVTDRTPGPTVAYASPRAKALEPLSAASFDPYGSGQGNQQPVPLATDGILPTAWSTEWYASANFGGLKPGTGLLLDMGRTVTVSDLRIVLGKIPGADFEIRVGAAASLSDLRTAARVTDAREQADVRLSKPARGRYVLIWFTKLPPDASGTFQVSVYSVSLQGWT
jgi:O-antigen/teichoic acid export membrane protein